MKQTEEKNSQINEGVVEVTTLFDSDLAEYEWIQEQKEKAEKEKAESEAK